MLSISVRCRSRKLEHGNAESRGSRNACIGKQCVPMKAE